MPVRARASALRLALLGCLALSGTLLSAQLAQAATYYACVKKGGAAHIYTKPTKCGRGESRLSWNSRGPAGANGTSGANGKDGANGANGSNGVNGKNGTDGQNLTSQTPLPGGESESGAFAVGSAGGNKGFAAEGISFAQPLDGIIPGTQVVFNTPHTTSANCPGVGQAARGYLCFYAGEEENLSFYSAFGFAGEGHIAVYGFTVFFKVSGEGFIDGAWTATAP
jgi:hypothetical protein